MLQTTELFTEVWAGSEQHTWLENELKTIAKRRAQAELDWVVVAAHYPLYCSYNWTGCCGDHKTCGHSDYTKWEPLPNYRLHLAHLMEKYNVDLYLNGHTHNYERTYPVAKNKRDEAAEFHLYKNPKHPVYVTAGGPGDIEILGDRFIGGPPPWSAIQLPTENPQSPASDSRVGFGK